MYGKYNIEASVLLNMFINCYPRGYTINTTPTIHALGKCNYTTMQHRAIDMPPHKHLKLV